ncbi:MAG: hypothetical protein RML95_05555 [Anaerolineae bacterium]|nr:hypothetical protein [Anaerolineae bacterium]MDW8298785.1 hypothetical protein [Anaerolineae bacterium]
MARALALIRCCSAQRGVKGDVIAPITSWTRLDVASALALSARLAAPTGDFACQTVERCVQLARVELSARINLFTAFPPTRVAPIKDGL